MGIGIVGVVGLGMPETTQASGGVHNLGSREGSTTTHREDFARSMVRALRGMHWSLRWSVWLVVRLAIGVSIGYGAREGKLHGRGGKGSVGASRGDGVSARICLRVGCTHSRTRFFMNRTQRTQQFHRQGQW